MTALHRKLLKFARLLTRYRHFSNNLLKVYFLNRLSQTDKNLKYVFYAAPGYRGRGRMAAPDKWQPRKLQGGDRTLVQFCLRVHAKQVNQQV